MRKLVLIILLGLLIIGSAGLAQADYVLYDEKGGPFGGIYYNDSYILRPGLLPLFVPAGVPAVPDLTIVTDTLPVGTVGYTYDVFLSASGGTPPYTWDRPAFDLMPHGMNFATATGQISGIPTEAGIYDITFRVIDSSSPSKTAIKTLRIDILEPEREPLVITTSALPDATVGEPYLFALAAANGVLPYSWSVMTNPPPGINISEGGVLTGPATQAGSFNFTVRVTDNDTPHSEATKQLSIMVNEPVPETGSIINTRIERMADSRIKLTWEYSDPAIADAGVDIWRLMGRGQEYTTLGVQFSRAAQGLAGTEFIETAPELRAGSNVNAYYRVVPTGGIYPDVFDPAKNNTTVGKVDVPMNVGWNMVAIPLVQQFGYSIDAVIGRQLTAGSTPGDEVYTADLAKTTYENNNWTDANLELRLGEGLYVRILDGRQPITLTFVGEVPTTVQAYTLPTGFRRIGNSSCKNFTLDAAFATAFGGSGTSAGDEMYNNELAKMTKENATWVGSSPFEFKIGQGYWYYRRPAANDYNWELTP